MATDKLNLIIAGIIVIMAIVAVTFLGFEGKVTSDAVVGIYSGVISGGVGFIVGKKNTS